MAGAETAVAVAAEASKLGTLADKNFSAAMTMMIGPSIAALGISFIGSKACEAVSRNPEAAAKIQTITILTAAFTEAIAIYCLVVALILKFV